MRIIKNSLWFFLLLVICPIIVAQFPTDKTSSTSNELQPNLQLALAYQEPEKLTLTNSSIPSSKVLIYFTHPEEAYTPVTEKVVGQAFQSHPNVNVQSLSTTFKQQFELQLVQTDILNVNVSAEIQAQNLKYKDSYQVIRPFVQSALKNEQYQLVLDIHRDAVAREATTLTVDGVSYAKIALVIGSKHKNYDANLVNAQKLHNQLDSLMPGISRGILQKGEKGSNGIYNQDLASNVLLIELGGVGNSEEELIRTITILGKAIANMFKNEQL